MSLSVQSARATMRQSFYAFTQFIASADKGGESNLFTDRTFYPLCRYLQNLYYGSHRRFNLRDPRNHGKTTIAIRSYALWIAIQRPHEEYDSPEEFARASEVLRLHPHMLGPNERILLANSSRDNADIQARAIRMFPEQNALFRSYWPELCPENFARHNKKRIWNEQEFALPTATSMSPEPFISTAGITSQSTSRHYPIILLDDPVTETTWQSVTENQAAIDWIDLAEFLLEVADIYKPNASLMGVIGNHWTYFDPSTYIEENKPSYDIWHRTCWQCANCGYERCVRGPDCFKTDIPIWPERWTRDGLLRMKSELTPRLFSAQYENDPIASEATAFNADNLRACTVDLANKEVVVFKPNTRIVEERIALAALRGIISFDPATSRDQKSCRSAICVVGENRENQAVYFLDLVAENLDPASSIQAVLDLYRKWRALGLPIAHVGFEAVAGQKFILPALTATARSQGVWQLASLPAGESTDLIQLYKTDTNIVKEERIKSLLSWRIESGLLYINTGLPRHNLFLEEVTRFPVSKSNDILDALAYCEQLYIRVTRRKDLALKQRAAILQKQRAAERARG